MTTKCNIFFTVAAVLILVSCKNKEKNPLQMTSTDKTEYYNEPYRPQFHFSPQEKWMNDPNGMVYHKGVYHLFYQYYPEDIVWGPMHWGHATSKDLIHWTHKPIALFPDEHGLIFSGSAVVDFANSSGFGTLENPPLVAIYTYHLMAGEKAGRTDFQTQGIAYSLDNGETWTKYADNPVIGNEGIKDFRDPKVFWDTISNSWIMSLVAGDHLQLWNSDDLKNWSKLSEFGKNKGAHGGVWECPDLFKLKVAGTNEEKWILLISINPGAPNGGSGTQYFVGDFDGEKFTTEQDGAKWLDWGTDNYAGVTYNVLPDDFYGDTYENDPKDSRIFIGWMSNWAYARDTPTEKWRSAMTVPRTLTLQKNGSDYEVLNYPIDGIDAIVETGQSENIVVESQSAKTFSADNLNQAEILFMTASKDFQLTFSNTQKDTLSIHFSELEKMVTVDRSKSGKTTFQEDFHKVQKMPVSLPSTEYEVRMLLDHSSIEIFIDKGRYVMTAQLFPNDFFTDFKVQNSNDSPLELNNFQLSGVKRIW